MISSISPCDSVCSACGTLRAPIARCPARRSVSSSSSPIVGSSSTYRIVAIVVLGLVRQGRELVAGSSRPILGYLCGTSLVHHGCGGRTEQRRALLTNRRPLPIL